MVFRRVLENPLLATTYRGGPGALIALQYKPEGFVDPLRSVGWPDACLVAIYRPPTGFPLRRLSTKVRIVFCSSGADPSSGFSCSTTE